jgi:hypothetical protein
MGVTTWAQPPANDDATGAILLPVGAICLGSIYTNADATQSAGEPYANCNNENTGTHTVWFSFQAPPSGTVRVTTDNGATGTLSDTKIGLFEAANAADYGTFNIIGCDEDNGADNGTTDQLSTLFATGLTPGATYYVQVDGRTPAATGTFCLQVQEVNPTMLAPAASCAPVQSPVGNNASYNGWLTLVDQSGLLVALVRNPTGGEAGAYSGSYHVNSNGFVPPRQSLSGISYLNRNFHINNTTVTAPVDMQFFFHPGEIITYNGGNVATLNVTRQTGAVCNADFVEANGITSVLPQTSNGTVNGIGWIQVTTPGFSNFYLMDGTAPLPVTLAGMKANNEGSYNKVTWNTASEASGDYFELERSADGKAFSFLARVDAKGKAGTYMHEDRTPLPGDNYYRLKLSDRDGGYAYSGIVKASLSPAGKFSIAAFPNPASKMMTITVKGSVGHAMLSLCDVTGKVIRSYPVSASATSIDMGHLSKGIYLLRYADGQQVQALKVIKE